MSSIKHKIKEVKPKSNDSKIKFRINGDGNINYGKYSGDIDYTSSDGLANIILNNSGSINAKDLRIVPNQTSIYGKLTTKNKYHIIDGKYSIAHDDKNNKYELGYKYNPSQYGLHAGLAFSGDVNNSARNRYSANIGYRFQSVA